jgi:bifunctional DNA-binding transcriptional regulator/antitoxin component of YhaV-PrlF toxin-antitoxin module
MPVSAEDGRIYLPKELREKYGDRFHVVEKGDKIVLVPVSDDPLEALREEFESVEKSASELKDEALSEGLEEAGS